VHELVIVENGINGLTDIQLVVFKEFYRFDYLFLESSVHQK